MKILLIAPSELPIPNVKGGAIETLATYLLKENEKSTTNIEFLVICKGDIAARKEIQRYKKTRCLFFKRTPLIVAYELVWRVLRKLFPHKVYKHWGRIFKFRREIKYFNPDLVLIEGNYGQLSHAKSLGKPVALHLHTDLINKETPNVQRIINEKPIYWVISGFLKQRIEEVGGDKIEVFRNCIDTDIFITKAKQNVRHSLDISDNEKVLLYCGRVVPIKGVKELVIAFHKSHEENLSLLIVGGSNFADSTLSPYEQEIRDYINKHSLNVKFTGYVPPSELPSYYQAADYFAYPSICNEAAGLGIIEATCSGLSVITTNMGGIPEYIEKDRTIVVENDSFLIDNLAKAIHKQCNNPIYKKRIPSSTDKYVADHGLSAYYENFCKLINTIVK